LFDQNANPLEARFIRLSVERRNNLQGMSTSPLLAFSRDFNFAAAEERNFRWEFIVEPPTLLEYIGQIFAWLRLCLLEEPNGGFNGAEFWATKVLLFDTLSEDWGAEDTIGWVRQDLFDVLTTRLDADPESKEYKVAYKTTWRMLTPASMQKVTHGKHLTKTPALGILLDKKENAGKDVEPGTFTELLRYGSVHLEQNRATIDYVKAEKSKQIIKKVLLEC
jgi:hypothetical protein